MRRIESEAEKRKRQNRNKAAVGIIFIFLLVSSTLGFALYGRSSDTIQEQEDGYYNGQYWVYTQGEQQYYFINNLASTSGVEVDIGKQFGSYLNVPLYIRGDDLVANEIAMNLGRFSSRVQKACYLECSEDLPEKDCSENLIVFTESETRKVYEQENCVFIDGDLTSVDAFLYEILDIGE